MAIHLSSEGHVRENVLPREHRHRHTMVGIVDGERAQVHMSEEIEALGQLVCRQHAVGLFDHVGTQVDILVSELFGDVLHLVDTSISAVHVRAEIVPVQKILALRGNLVVTLTSEPYQSLRSFILSI